MKDIGLYIHVPFCKSKCPYCDFYSMRGEICDFDGYTMCLLESMESWANKLCKKADTLYFGGGTPSLIGADNISMLTKRAKLLFGVDGEITVECNPSAVNDDFFDVVARSGVNRISIGMQSAVDEERKRLGRTADRNLIKQRILRCRKAGIKNISLDVMLGIPNQTADSLKKTLEFCVSSGVEHISAYILKLEEGTFFYKNQSKLNLPDDDATADMYLLMCDFLARNGYEHYEISNFAKKGFEGKHNLKYWNCEEYLGLGPSAHSFIEEKRFFYPRELKFFIDEKEPISDGTGGDSNEYIMLRLRLKDGLCFADYEEKFGRPLDEVLINKAKKYIAADYIIIDSNKISLTEKGFLVSNSIISDLIL